MNEPVRQTAQNIARAMEQVFDGHSLPISTIATIVEAAYSAGAEHERERIKKEQESRDK